MHPKLEKYLQKIGVKNSNELSEEEKQTFDEWKGILSGGQVTVDKIKQFCTEQIKVIEGQWKNLDNSPQKNERLILLHTVYSTLSDLITSPEADRERLEKQLDQMLTTK